MARNAAALPPQAREVCGQPLPLPRAAFGLIEMSLARNQSAAPGFETLKLPARSENVGREVGHIAQRPCQQRRHDLFGNARHANAVDPVSRNRVHPQSLLEQIRVSEARGWAESHEFPSPGHCSIAAALPVVPAMLAQKTRGLYPAPQAALEAMIEGAMVDYDTATRIESRKLAKIMVGQNAKNMITAFFFGLNAIKSGKSRPPIASTWKPKKVGVLGAGMMGHGIAHANASRGIRCVMLDVSIDKARAGFDAIVGKPAPLQRSSGEAAILGVQPFATRLDTPARFAAHGRGPTALMAGRILLTSPIRTH